VSLVCFIISDDLVEPYWLGVVCLEELLDQMVINRGIVQLVDVLVDRLFAEEPQSVLNSIQLLPFANYSLKTFALLAIAQNDVAYNIIVRSFIHIDYFKDVKLHSLRESPLVFCLRSGFAMLVYFFQFLIDRDADGQASAFRQYYLKQHLLLVFFYFLFN